MATILIVDDRVENREFLVALLSYGQHRLLEASDGIEGLSVARAETPDLIITDLLMPTMDGFEFVRQLRIEPRLKDVGVIFYTATYLEADARGLAEACGVTHILTKPAEPEVVLRMVSEVLQGVAPLPPSPPRDEFDSAHLRLLTMTLAHKAEVVVPRLNAIIELSVRLASEMDPSTLLQTFCAGARKTLGARYGVVLLSKRAHDGDGTAFSSGLDPAAALQLPGWLDGGHDLARLLERKRTVRSDSGEGVALPEALPPAHSWLAAAVRSPEKVYGCVCLAELVGGGDFTDEEEELAGTLGGLVGRVYENGSLYAAMRRHADDLARSDQRFRLLAGSIPEVFWIADVDPFSITYVSPAYETVWGRPVATLYERPWSWMDSVVPEDVSEAREFLELPRGGKVSSREFRIRRPGGDIGWIWAQGFPARDAAGRLERVTGIALDITDRVLVDQQLRQSQKMEAVGRLAGGVAHDFNNLLGVIMGYGEGALRTLPVDHAARTKVEQVLKAAERAARVTRHLLTFSRRQVPTPRVLDLNGIVGEMEKMLRTLIGEDIELVTLPGRDLGFVRIDMGEMEQVIVNLAVNARDAMPSGGKLRIETENEFLDPDFVQQHPGIEAGSYVRLLVSDTGHGMSKEVMQRIFEPFFTTKEVGKGTGLGLSTVYGIVKQAGGLITVDSVAGRGTSFGVYLPRTQGAAELSSAPSMAIPRGNETILLVEDEDLLRTITREILEGCGYAVLEAASGKAALDLASSHRGPIHLLVTDVIMLGLSGPETAARMAASRSETRVLYISGYTDEAMAQHGVLPAHVAFLPKPFTQLALARKVRETLDGVS